MPRDIQAKLLIVDDLPENLLALEALIKGGDREVFKALSADEALSLLLQHDFALAIIDVQMPEMNGFQLAELMRGTEKTRSIPIFSSVPQGVNATMPLPVMKTVRWTSCTSRWTPRRSKARSMYSSSCTVNERP